MDVWIVRFKGDLYGRVTLREMGSRNMADAQFGFAVKTDETEFNVNIPIEGESGVVIKTTPAEIVNAVSLPDYEGQIRVLLDDSAMSAIVEAEAGAVHDIAVGIMGESGVVIYREATIELFIETSPVLDSEMEIYVAADLPVYVETEAEPSASVEFDGDGGLGVLMSAKPYTAIMCTSKHDVNIAVSTYPARVKLRRARTRGELGADMTWGRLWEEIGLTNEEILYIRAS